MTPNKELAERMNTLQDLYLKAKAEDRPQILEEEERLLLLVKSERYLIQVQSLLYSPQPFLLIQDICPYNLPLINFHHHYLKLGGGRGRFSHLEHIRAQARRW